MPLFQVKSKVNSQTVNTDLECDSLEDAIAFYNVLSVAEIEQIKKYVWINPITTKKIDDGSYKYATISVFLKDKSIIKIKIPKLKKNKSVQELKNYFLTIYQNVLKVEVSIRT